MTTHTTEPIASGTAQGQAPRTVREQACRIVAAIADRLGDAPRVASVATGPGNVDRLPGRPPVTPWYGPALAEGHAAVALLFTELARTDPRHRATSHAHLTYAVRQLSARPGGLLTGPVGPAFAAQVARRSADDYAALLHRFDGRVAAQVQASLAVENRRLDAVGTATPATVFDLVHGLTGLGRYLLLRRPRDPGLIGILHYLVRLSEPRVLHGHRVPGWWAPGAPPSRPALTDGHAYLGLAHGICGPLGLLALAEEAGVRVPGQEEAAARIVDWLLGWRAIACGWPAVVGLHEQVGCADGRPPEARSAWCHGAPGLARALYLAGRAWRRDAWRRAAVDTLAVELAAPRGVHDAGLCHGWAGLLHITGRMAYDSGDARLAARLPHLAARVVARYDPAEPFGYRYECRGAPLAPHRAGLLDGAAGIALALHAWTLGAPPATTWDASLLLA